jgi:anti-sigma B factor antagonist
MDISVWTVVAASIGLLISLVAAVQKTLIRRRKKPEVFRVNDSSRGNRGETQRHSLSGSEPTSRHGDVLVIRPRRNLVGKSETEELATLIAEALTRGEKRIVIDMERVDYVNSTGFGALVRAVSAAKEHGASVRLANVHERVKAGLLVTKLVLVFDVSDSVDDAAKILVDSPNTGS